MNWANFATNGYPSIVPWYCISAEFIGAICLIPGIYTRWVCLYTLPLIAGAVQFWAVRKGFFFTAQCGEPRFGDVRAPHKVQWPTDNGSVFAAYEPSRSSHSIWSRACPVSRVNFRSYNNRLP